MHAPLHTAGQEWHVQCGTRRLVYQDDRGLMDLAGPKLFGRHHSITAGLAIAALRALDAFQIEPAAFEAGVVNAEWPARMQRLVSGGFMIRAAGSEIWLGWRHNAKVGASVAAALGDLESGCLGRLVVIVGMMANKDARAFLANFAGLTRHIVDGAIPVATTPCRRTSWPDAARASVCACESAASVMQRWARWRGCLRGAAGAS